MEVAASPIIVNGGRDKVAVTISVGIASTDEGAKDDSSQRLIKRADEALYLAKNGGRNRVIQAAAA
jgi:two-component system cell cycle response regulator